MWRVSGIVVFTFVLLSLAGSVGAKDDPRRTLVQAATHDAMSALRRDVLSSPINADLTVGQLVDQTGGRDAFDAALRSAQQVGGTRWIGDDTCMVRVELTGDSVAAALIDVVRDHPKDSPIPAVNLQKRLESWRSRTFSAEGSSTGANAAKEFRPPEDNVAWRSVSPAARREAVASARAGAAERVLNSIEDVSIADSKTVGDALDVPTVRETMRSWLAQRPVVDVQFHRDLNVELALAAPAEELWAVFRKALESQKQVPLPSNEAEWTRLHDKIAERLAPAVGRAAAAKGVTAKTASASLPDRAPRWTSDSLDASGVSKKGDSKLLTKKHAEDEAIRSLRRQIEKLPLNDGATLGKVAQTDASVDAAIERSLLRARVYKVAYLPDGGVDVRYTLDLRVLWHELNAR